MKNLLILTIFIAFTLSLPTVYPPPNTFEMKEGAPLKLNSLCDWELSSENSLDQDLEYYMDKILRRFDTNLQQCKNAKSLKTGTSGVQLKIQIGQELNKEGYQLLVTEEEVEITVKTYSGYVYAMESLSQLISYNQENDYYEIPQTFIADEPLVEVRGIMIDSARHFLGVPAIKRLLQSMALFKLNILHWHITDDESFPLKLASHPELAEGAYSSSEVYTVADLKDLIAVADKNAIKIIPEIDTPAHVLSMGKSAAWKDKGVVKNCIGVEGYNGQLNVSNPLTYKLVEEVFKQIDQIFTASPYLHMGGDEVSSKCWDGIPEIKKFMEDNKIANYGELQMYWRKQVKSILPQHRKTIYWRNNADGVKTQADDVLQFWGNQKQTSQFVNTTDSKIIMSQSDLLYLNKGQGFIWGNDFGRYTIWRQLYEELLVFPPDVDKGRILGMVAALWGEVSNEDTLENNLWMRSAAFAGRVWTEQKLDIVSLAKDLIKMEKTLQGMGVDPSPITSEFCEIYVDRCFTPHASKQKRLAEIQKLQRELKQQ